MSAQYSRAGLLDRAQSLAASFAENAAARDAGRVYPDREVARLKESGLLALFVPQRYGGIDADYRTATEVFAILAEADPNIAHIPQAHHCAVELLKLSGAEKVMEWLFPRVVEGKLISSAYVDRGHARKINDVAGVTLRCERGEWWVSGAKFYVTGSRWADILYGPVTVVCPDGVLPTGANSAVVWLDADAPGVTVEDDWDAMGQRTTASGSVVFEDVPIRADRIISNDLSPDSPNNYYGAHAQIIFCAIQLGIRARCAEGRCALRAV